MVGSIAAAAHPLAWWGWALSLATVAALNHNPWLNLLIIAVTALVVTTCRGNEPWSGTWRIFLYIGLTVIAIRFTFYLVFGGVGGTTVLFELPEWSLGSTGFSIGGPITAEGALAAFYDGLRLATLLICVGAANSLASPRRLLKNMPTALYEIALAIVVGLTLVPQLAASVSRIRRAKSLRGNSKRGPVTFMRTVLTPVLTDALDRSLQLAASMASRGYGRATASDAANHRRVAVLSLVALVALLIGTYGLLTSTNNPITWVFLALGLAGAIAALRYASRRLRHTRYRDDKPQTSDRLILGIAAVTVILAVVNNAVDPAQLWPTPGLTPPPLPLLGFIGVLSAIAPAVIVPKHATVKGQP